MPGKTGLRGPLGKKVSYRKVKNIYLGLQFDYFIIIKISLQKQANKLGHKSVFSVRLFRVPLV